MPNKKTNTWEIMDGSTEDGSESTLQQSLMKLQQQAGKADGNISRIQRIYSSSGNHCWV